ncbi:MAG: WG repeat-containing protein [Clostridia bacterium]|nr:WG repeat-containing protein [Clostridia bacterium]
MGNILEWIKSHKIKVGIIVAVVLIIVIVTLGIYFYIDYQNKKYEVEEVSSFRYYPIYERGKMGVIDTNGNVLIDPIYENVKIPNPEKAVFICKEIDKTIVQNDKKEVLFSEFEEVSQIDTKGTVSNIPYEKRVLRYKQNGKYGLIDYDGKVITKPIYETIESLENKESELLVQKDGKYGVINQKGASIIEIEYDSIVADGYYDEEHKYALSGYIVSLKTRKWISLWLHKFRTKKSIRC